MLRSLFYIISGNFLEVTSIFMQIFLLSYLVVLQAITFSMLYLMEIGKARMYALLISCLITWVLVGSISDLFLTMLYQKGIVASASIMVGSTSIFYVLSLLLSVRIEKNKM